MKHNRMKEIYFMWDAIFTSKEEAEKYCVTYYDGEEPGRAFVTYAEESDFGIVLEKDGVALLESGAKMHSTKEKAVARLEGLE